MTESGGIVRLLTSRSQHISLSHLESSEVTKGTIVPLDPSAFSAIEGLPLPLSARMQAHKTSGISFNYVRTNSIALKVLTESN